jgi:hypothetical protein
MTFALRKSRMTAPLQRRTEKIGSLPCRPVRQQRGCGENRQFAIPKGSRRRVYRPDPTVARDRADCQLPLNGVSAASIAIHLPFALKAARSVLRSGAGGQRM